MSNFSKQFFVNNRKQLAASAKAEVFVFVANGQLQRNSDCAYPFRQDSSFWYLTGIELPEVVLVINTVTGKDWLLMPERSDFEELFDDTLTPDELTEISGIEDNAYGKVGWERLKKEVAGRSVATLEAAPAFVEVYSLHTNPGRRVLHEKLASLGATKVTDVREEIVALRTIKQPQEIAVIKKAVDITCQTFQDIHSNLNSYKNEREIETDLLTGYRRRGADGHSFSPVVASGANAVTLHYQKNNQPIRANEFLLIDSGAELSNYAADITRTYAIGKPSPRHSAVYEAVYKASCVGIELMRPGNTFKQVDDAIGESLEESLRQLGLEAEGDKTLLRTYYPHTSHYMGLDVHDVGDRDRPLESGMVWTIEPGIYIPKEGIGVRIEDNVLITEKGHELLSGQLPVKPSDILG